MASWGGGMSASCKLRGSNCSLTRSMDGRIVRCGIISSCQSAVTSETVRRAIASIATLTFKRTGATTELRVSRLSSDVSHWIRFDLGQKLKAKIFADWPVVDPQNSSFTPVA